MDLLQRLEKATPKPGERVEQYELESELGRGGCGIVFKALNHRLGDDVALKVMIPQMAPAHLVGELFKRFEREARILRTLRHPHVVRITDIGRTDQGFPYFVMELIDGPTLEDVVQETSLPEARVAGIALQVLEALEAAHELGIVHRDLKPGNIMLRRDLGLEDYVIVLDFGIAKLLDSEATLLTTSVSGTPWYMAPEQAKLDDLDGRVDVYALGVIMAECLTGERVVATSKPFSAAVVHASDEPLPFHDRVRSSALFPIIARATAKDRDARFESAAAMRLALAEIASSLDVEAPDPVVPPRSEPTSASDRAADEEAGGGPADESEVGVEAEPPPSARRLGELGGARVTARRSRWLTLLAGVALAAVVGVVIASRATSPGSDDATPAAGVEPNGGPTGPMSTAALPTELLDDALACGEGDGDACLRVAEVRAPPSPEAEGWEAVRRPLEQACSAGLAVGCARLGNLHLEGLGVPADVSEAIRHYERACDRDGAHGCLELAALLRDGRQVPRDISRSGRLFERACQADDPIGCNELGLLYEQGLEGVQNDQRAAALFESACQGGLPAGCTNLASHADDPTRATELFEQACRGDDALGCYRLGLAYEDGRGVVQNAAVARRYLEQACRLGQTLACQRLDRGASP